MPRRQTTQPAPKLEGIDLPELTNKQYKFVQLVLEGKTLTDSYKGAYDCATMAETTIWAAASRMRHDCKITAWISAARRAGADHSIRTAATHIANLTEIREEARASGNYGDAAQCEIHTGKVSGLYQDQLEITHKSSDLDLINAIAQGDPTLAAALRKRLLGEDSEDAADTQA